MSVLSVEVVEIITVAVIIWGMTSATWLMALGYDKNRKKKEEDKKDGN